MKKLLFALAACGSPKPAPAPPPPDPMAGMDHSKMAMPHGAHLAISCGDQATFDKGFNALHNMDYVRARQSFNAGAAAAPQCAIFEWGVAMTYFQPLWPGQPTKEAIGKGVDAIAKARAATQATPAEKTWIAAAGAFYDDAPDYASRLKNWAAQQKDLAAKAPDDLEAQAFAALARLATVDKKDKTYAEQTAVAALLEQLLAKHPDHPGLMHYLLHAYDNPLHASQAVEIAKKYAATSPESAHALHMPSHINVRLGNWKEVIASNLASKDAALKSPGDGGLVSRDLLHATDYLVYGYLQLGDDAKAAEAAKVVDPATKFEPNSGPGAYGLAATPARYALERRDWKAAAAVVVRGVPYDWDHFPWAEAEVHAARGLGAARSKDVKLATAEIAELDRLKPLVDATWWQGRIGIDRDVIAGWLEKDPKQAEKLMQGAADRELAGGKDNVEPGHVITAAEELGDWLLDHKRPKDALVAFQKALAESPHRLNALFGAGTAAEQAAQNDDAKRYFTEIVEMTDSSSQRPSRAHAVEWLSKHR